MNITIYTVTYNEELLIQLMIDHYRSRFPNCHIVVYDNQSTDRTVEIAKANGCEIRWYDSGGQVNDQMLWETKNNCWRDAKTDWVIVCDLDEMLDINAQQLQYEHSIGTTKIKCECWHMVNLKDNLDVRNIKYGCRNPNDTVYDKDLMFNKSLVNINYINNDCHFTNSTGVIRNSLPYKMYHYKYVNPDVFVNKQKVSASRLSEINKKNGWGAQCLRDESSLRAEFQQARDAAVRVLPELNHFYQNIEGDFNSENLYAEVIRSLPANSFIVEVGATQGRSTAYLAVESINSAKNVKLDVIGCWNEDELLNFKKNVGRVLHGINVVKESESFNQYTNRTLDFVLLNHKNDYTHTKNEITNWLPKLKEGGIIAGTKYAQYPEVERAVVDFFGKQHVIFIDTGWAVKLCKNTVASTGFWTALNPFHVISIPLCDWVINYLKDQKETHIYDFGCGTGMYLNRLKNAGFSKLCGFEGSVPKNKIFDNIVEQDLTKSFSVDTKGNVISLEVAEHIPSQFTDNYLSNIYNACMEGGTFICSWAVRGQGGEGHVNELNNEEAIRLITNKGFTYLPDETTNVRSLILDVQDFDNGHLPWFKNTTLIFKKK